MKPQNVQVISPLNGQPPAAPAAMQGAMPQSQPRLASTPKPFLDQPFNPKELMRVLQRLESTDNPMAWKKDEDARGILQIRKPMIDDVNRIISLNKDKESPLYGMSFKHQDAFDPEKAALIFDIYSDFYTRKFWLKREPTNRDVARMWNGGPKGKDKELTKYEGKVQNISKELYGY